jgi:hypothetical protein
MSRIALSPNAAGTGTFTIASPGTNTDRTANLPDASTTLVGTDATQTLTNKTIQSSTIQGGAITSGTAVASTSGTSIDFTGIPSWAKRVTVMLSGVSTNGTSNYLVQIGAGSVTTTGYLGGYANTGNSANSTIGFGIFAGSAAVVMHATMTIVNVTGNTWLASHVGGRSDAASVTFGGGNVTLGGTLDRVRITTVNGTDTFDAGSVNILYEG